MYDFNPMVINDFLEFGNKDFDDRCLDIDEVTNVITGGTVSKWPGNKKMKNRCLSSKYAILERVVGFNWMPVSRQSTVKRELACLLYKLGTGIGFNLCQVILNQIVRHAENKGGHKADIPFPNLIYGILRPQGFSPDPTEPFENLLGPITIDARLLSGPHFLDIDIQKSAHSTVGPSTQAATSILLRKFWTSLKSTFWKSWLLDLMK